MNLHWCRRSVCARLAVVALLATILPSFIAGPASASIYVPDTPRAGWGTNGTVYAVVVSGDTVVVGGQFSAAVSPSGATTARANLAAFSLSTGALLTGWRADAGSTVRALAVSGASVFVGGDFTTLGGATRRGIGKVRLGDGAVDATFAPSLTKGGARALETIGSSVYVGGAFTTVNGSTTHGRLVKLNATSGAVDDAFSVTLDNEVRALTGSSSGDRLFVAGRFSTVNGGARSGLVALGSKTGALTTPTFAGSSPALALDLSTDGTRVYAGQVNNRAVAYSTSTGRQVWSVTADGDIQAIRNTGSSVVAGFHDGYQDDTTVKAVAINASSGVVDPDWSPSINVFDGVFAIDATSAGLVLGGAFTTVSGVSAPRLAVFRP